MNNPDRGIADTKGHEDSIKDSRFKAAWQMDSTRTIRVPIALADATLEYARQLDQGIEPHDIVDSLVSSEVEVNTIHHYRFTILPLRSPKKI